MTRLIVLVGLPGSGKSTYAQNFKKEHPDEKWIVCSSDETRKELYGDASIQGNPDVVFKHLHKKVKTYLKQDISVIYDATNVTRKNRKTICEIGKDYQLEAHIVWTPYEECIKNDSTRQRRVGDDIIKRMLYRFEMPFYDEGFEKIHIHRNIASNFNREAYIMSVIDSMKIPHDNPHHTYDIDKHCEHAYNYIVEKYPDIRLIEAARIHDCGKPFTKFFKYDENGNIISNAHYYNHDNVGAYLSIGMYTNDHTDFEIWVPWLISSHMQPFFNSKYYKTMKSEYKEFIDKLHEADINSH